MGFFRILKSEERSPKPAITCAHIGMVSHAILQDLPPTRWNHANHRPTMACGSRVGAFNVTDRRLGHPWAALVGNLGSSNEHTAQ